MFDLNQFVDHMSAVGLSVTVISDAKTPQATAKRPAKRSVPRIPDDIQTVEQLLEKYSPRTH